MRSDEVSGGGFPVVVRGTVWVLLAILLISGLLLHGQLASNLDRIGDNSGVESEQLAGLRDLLHGRPLYWNFSESPHLIRGYTPLFYLVPGLIAKGLGVSDSEAFLVGRCYVYVFWLAVGFVVYWLGRQAGCMHLFALLAAVLWFGGQLATQWANSYRPDAPALFFSLAAFGFYRASSRPVHRVAVLFLLAAAFLHKQSAVSALAAIVFEEVRRKRYCWATIMTSGWVAVVVVAMASAQLLTNGAFAINILGSLWGVCTWETTLVLWEAAAIHGLVVLSGGVMSPVERGNARGDWSLKIYFIVACVLALLGSRKYGSYVNYFLEPAAVGCVLTASLLQHWHRQTDGRLITLLRVAWLGLAVASCLHTAQARIVRFPNWLREAGNHLGVRRLQQQQLAKILGDLDREGGPILIEDPYLALWQSPEPFVIDSKQFAAMQGCGKFDDARLLQMIETGKFKAIVADSPLEVTGQRRFPLRWIEPMRKSYGFALRYDRNSGQGASYLYRPHSKTNSRADVVISISDGQGR